MQILLQFDDLTDLYSFVNVMCFARRFPIAMLALLRLLRIRRLNGHSVSDDVSVDTSPLPLRLFLFKAFAKRLATNVSDQKRSDFIR